MCIQVVERYSVCGCLYYSHQVDPCPSYSKRGHKIATREVLVRYACSKHSSSRLYRQSSARARRQAREEYQSEIPLRVNRWESLVHAQIEGSPQHARECSDDGQVVGSDGSIVQSLCFASDPTHTDCEGSTRVLLRYSPRTDIVDRDQAAVEISDPGGVLHSQSEAQAPSTTTTPLRELDTRHTLSPTENTCPHHLLQSVTACPRECGWHLEHTVERGDATTDISSWQLHHLLRDSLISAFANLSRNIGPKSGTQSSDPCRGTNSHTNSDTIELDILQNDLDSGTSTSRTPQLPTANSNNFNEPEHPSATTRHTVKLKKRPSIPPCYLLIFLGLLTVIGSLVPGLWQSNSRNDLSGGFSLAQYILGVGIFVVGSMVAIHSKTCECWKTHNRIG